eukprot:366163-Rhodomonas_salina.1
MAAPPEQQWRRGSDLRCPVHGIAHIRRLYTRTARVSTRTPLSTAWAIATQRVSTGQRRAHAQEPSAKGHNATLMLSTSVLPT